MWKQCGEHSDPPRRHKDAATAFHNSEVLTFSLKSNTFNSLLICHSQPYGDDDKSKLYSPIALYELPINNLLEVDFSD